MPERPPWARRCWCCRSCCCSRSTSCRRGGGGARPPRPEMAGPPPSARGSRPGASSYTPTVLGEPAWVRRLLVATAVAFLGLLLVAPLLLVFVQAFNRGW